ncbi:hypothetical protein IAR55_003681 [Kwoniella newhampshirensis]|uniref:Amidohydrolase-related domain-containing protein n=1 Tax=Kwoniella newhampshirensis TaxID=1651941 RepID=A0AAW0YN33_9TREE
MGLQARNTASRLPSTVNDVEKAPLVVEEEADSVKDRQLSRPFYKHPLSLPIGVLVLLLTSFITHQLDFDFPFPSPKPPSGPLPKFIEEGIKQCEIIARPPPNPKPFDSKRTHSDRFVKGTKPTWLKNGTVWTGESDGTEILYGADVYIDGGVVRKIGKEEDVAELVRGKEYDEVELNGAWVTPGIVDTHSHMGVDSAPSLKGSSDTNSLHESTQPWLRSLDGFNAHDLAFNNSIAGGITTMLVLPGSAGAIGGQAFTFKPRWTYENTPQSMQVEPPYVINTHGNGSWERTGSWIHLKSASGENPSRVYSDTRMDTYYKYRKAYTQGKKIKDEQDRWCESPKTQTEPFPTNLEYEALAEVIRGKVKVNIHSYEPVDINALVRISNEFQFPIATFHHAHSLWAITDLVKQAWGPTPPAVAIFATNARYKRESYFHATEFAPKILADNGLSVIMKSDHPVLDSRYLIYEASQAHHYGLNFSQSLGSVTTHPAKAMGLDHRLGYIRPGYDADIVVWDSFPLALGATPKQTYIDGIPQIINPQVIQKPAEAQEIFPEGEWDKEIAETIATRGETDLRPKKSAKNILFQDVAAYYFDKFDVSIFENGRGDVVVQNGEITCAGKCAVEEGIDFEVIDLKGGSIAPGLISVGSYLGLMEIRGEKSTQDGIAPDILTDDGAVTDGVLVRAVDGAQFGGRDELIAYRAGVTSIVAAPQSNSLFAGLSFAFSPAAPHPLADGAIQNPTAALHISIDNSKSSVSSKFAVLRRLLLGEVAGADTELTAAMKKAAKGELTLVIMATKADVIAAVVRLKEEVGGKVKITILDGDESWLIADELAAADIGVIVAPARSYPGDWNSRRFLAGPPVTNQTLPSYLASRGVKVGLGIKEEWQARNTRYDAAWVYANSPEVFTKSSALDLVSKNLEELLGLNDDGKSVDDGKKAWVAYEGDLFGFEGRVKGVKGYGSEQVDLF